MDQSLGNIIGDAIREGLGDLRSVFQVAQQFLTVQQEVRKEIKEQYQVFHEVVKDLYNENSVRDKETKEQLQGIRDEIKDLRKENNMRDKETKRKGEFANVYNRFSVVDARLDAMNATLANSKLAYLPQKITPFPMFDDSNNRLPIPECFPSRLATLISLKSKRHWPKLRELLAYYQLEAVTIQVIYDQDTVSMDSMDCNFTGSQYKYTEQQLQDAIAADPERAISILGSHLGIDPVVLRKRSSSHDFSQMLQQLGKRARHDNYGELFPNTTREQNGAQETPSKKPCVNRMSPKLPEPAITPPIFDWDVYYEAHASTLGWEPDASKFRRDTAHLPRIRDTTWDTALKHQQYDGGKGDDPVEKEPRSPASSWISTEKIPSSREGSQDGGLH
ncbi:hypothetical protein BO78DRAFT_378861 [Aspergillus sclerotiicarbonarius CBS 121057]|uniref:Uncharacterized protein n=1 Tax=Aspergillus sclerotiicarbonarius (strain CBS 121057 / IBT 28362) TaxID=1448318 RepID=A0A319F7M0_ASPSB|nr:hypothetical protein BO78DRAFT_378861 [Aspergillus sclerotiicarbonarius CBS 121057]